MADNYLQFSETLDNLTAEEEAWLEEQLESIVVFGDRECPEEDPPNALLPESDPDFTGQRFLRDNPDFDSPWGVLGFEYAFQDEDTPPARYLWLHADMYGEPAHVAWLIQKFLNRFWPEQCWSLTYANTCSKPRAGEFSGGAVFVTANEINWQAAEEYVEQQRAAFKSRKSVLCPAR